MYTFVDDADTALAQVHLVPVLFGSGTRMFVDEHVTLELLGVRESPHAAHLALPRRP